MVYGILYILPIYGRKRPEKRRWIDGGLMVVGADLIRKKADINYYPEKYGHYTNRNRIESVSDPLRNFCKMKKEREMYIYVTAPTEKQREKSENKKRSGLITENYCF